jgi:ComEC/Rec2-related protein
VAAQPALALRWPAQQAGVVAGFVVAFLYCLLAGWGVPAQRTLYMLGCVAFALVLRRETAPGRVLALALAVVLVLDPWAVMAAGFWLSFGAVALLFLVSSGRLVPEGRLRGALRAQWAVTLGLVPALLVLFQQFSLVSPLANAIAIPLVSFVVTPLAIGFAILPLQMLADLAHAAFALTMLPIDWLAELPWASWQQAAPPPWLAVLASLGCVWALLPRGTPARWVGLAMLLPLLLWAPARPRRGGPGDGARRGAGAGGACADRRPRPALRHRPGLLGRCQQRRAHPAALPAGGGRAAARQPGGHPPGQRPLGRRRGRADRHPGGRSALVPVAEPPGPPDRRRPPPALRGRPDVGLGRGALHHAPPGRAADDSPGSKTNDVACVLRVEAAA